MAALIFIDTAKPPASSAGFTMREPLDKRASDFSNIELDAVKLIAADEAAALVLITTAIIFLDLFWFAPSLARGLPD
jgi:hypothetical protein